MAERDLVWLTAQEIVDGLRAGCFSAEEVARDHLAWIEATDGALRAFLTVLSDEAIERARGIDERLRRGEEIGPLAGVPVAIKDNLCTRGVRTTAASRMLADFVPPYDATVVERLRAAGAIVFGKTNLDEFAMGSSTENSAFFVTRNPWDPQRVPGGSSGGSAAAVAAGHVPVALGSDTGGSIRQPASLCGVVGLKPTYGRVSRYGLIAFASSLDQIGPLARTVRDVALVLGVIAGRDERDSTVASVQVPDYVTALTGDARGLRVGVPDEYFVAGMEPGVERAVREAIDAFRDAGAVVEGTSLPHSPYALPAYYLVAPAEASSNLARYDGVRYGYRAADRAASATDPIARTRGEGFGAEVKRRIMLGTYALSSGYYDRYYSKAQQIRRLIKEDFDRAFARFDVLLTPTSPTVAFRIGERAEDPLTMYRSDACTLAVNMAGVPGISVPCGFVAGLPVGVQIIGRPFDEATVLRAADAYQRRVDVHLRRPPLAGRVGAPAGGEPR